MGLITKIKHSSHSEHFLLLKHPREPYECDGCKGLGLGPCYECEHEDCDFYLHEECAKATPSASHPFSKYSLRFHSRAPQKGERCCDACGQDVLGFVYQCKYKKKTHDYHPSCLKLQRTLTADDGTRLHLREKLPSKCLNCGSRETSNGIEGWSYVSSCGQYRYHVACVKDMILKKWKKGYFLQDGKVNETDNSLALQSAIPSRELELPSRKSSSKAKKTWIRKATKAIMIIISALFGDPTIMISLLVQQLLPD
ncbi:hypothetical protein NC653_026078 [Populus alba x Populus x berolinensis]|uniref:DC1 domain-containing protein n=1 Tax=Populus alba x Populus x berolinensis TaxID=444605 RepID=A0AAD6Q9U0_9ROSI|nr:hypothetical protein NC653_026078 [Populus alba x Populus x berolinensis]